jgi:hypothetical protein
MAMPGHTLDVPCTSGIGVSLSYSDWERRARDEPETSSGEVRGRCTGVNDHRGFFDL